MALLRLKTELRELEEDDEGGHAERIKQLRAEIARLQKEEALSFAQAMPKKKSSSDLNESSGRVTGDSATRIQLSPRPPAISTTARRVDSPRRTGADSPREGGAASPRGGGRLASPRSPQSDSPRSEAASMGKRVLERHVATLSKLFATPGQASAKRQELEEFAEAVALHDKDGAFKEMLNQFFNRLAEEKNAK